MKISGFTIARNAVKFQYPMLESIRSILPICDEFVVNVGDSEDNTLEMIKSLNDPKIRIIRTVWDFSQGKTVLSEQTNIALKECRGDWAIYLQSDEILHEDDLPKLKRLMHQNLDSGIDSLRFRWMHFYGSYFRYRVDYGWFQKQDRIIRNNGKIESFEDAYAFRRRDGQPVRRLNTGCLLYHYGWVHSEEIMRDRRVNAANIGFGEITTAQKEQGYSYGDLNRFPPYFGSHPAVMKERVANHTLSQEDLKAIRRKYWWHPMNILRARYKTFKRVRTPID